jgi:uncharacterized protein involved in outer membrane biogenesis
VARKLLIVAFVLVALVVIAGVLVRRLVDPEALRVALEQQATAAVGQPVTVGSLGWSGLARPRVVLQEVQIGSPAAITLARVEVAASLRALLARRVEDAGLVIAGSRIQLPLPFRLGGGAPAAPAAEGGTAVTIASVDRISLSDIELVSGSAKVTLDLESSLSGDRLAVSRVRLRSGTTSIDGSGEFSSLGARRGVFTTTADPLDLDEVLAIASAFSKPVAGEVGPVAPSQPLALDVRVQVTAPRGRVLGIDFTDLATTFALERGVVTLEPFGVSVFDGTVEGRLAMDTSDESSRVTVSAAVASLDVARMAAFAGSSGVITGRLGGRIDLQAAGGTPDVVFRTAGGRATLAVIDGTLPGLDLVSPVIRAFGRPGAAPPVDRSNAFSSIRGTFALANGVLRTGDLVMTSRDLDVKAQGTLRVAGARADMKADLILSEALTADAGRDLVRYAREGTRVIVPATIRGPLASPSVSIDVEAAASRALRNTVEDEVKKGLGRLFRR